MAFNLANGSFLTNKLLAGKYELVIEKAFSGLNFSNIKIDISNQPFVFSGKFHFGNNGYFNLAINTNNISYPFAKSLLTKNIAKALNIVTLNSPIIINTTLARSLNGGDPLVLTKWKTKNADLETPLVNFKKANFSGYFSNEVVKGLPRKDPNSKIQIDSLSAEWEGIPVKATEITIIDLNKPNVTGSFTSNFKLADFNAILNSDAIEMSDGLGKVKVDYNGPLDSINNNNAKIRIQFMLLKGTVAIKPMGIKLSECITDLTIQNSDLILHSMVAKGNKGSVINLWGNATNIFSFLEDVPGKATVQLNMYSPFLNITNLTDFLSAPKKVVLKKSNGTFKKSVNKLDHVLESGTIKVEMKADKIAYNQLLATGFKGSVQLSEGNWNLEKLKFNLAGGSFNIKANIKNKVNNQHPTNAKFNIKNIDASSFFYAFSDFGSKTFGYKNITGILNAFGNINGNLYANGNFNKQSLKGALKFSLKNGSLKKVEALEKIQEKIFKKRDFSDVRFAEIKNSVTINNGMVNIPRMQIESNVFGLFIEGQYALIGNTDLRIQVPLRNLNNNNGAKKPMLDAKNTGGGMSIFLRAKTGNDGKLSIVYDPFGRFRKNNTGSPKQN